MYVCTVCMFICEPIFLFFGEEVREDGRGGEGG